MKRNLYKIFYITSTIILALLIFTINLWADMINYQNKISNHFIGNNSISFSFQSSNDVKSDVLESIYKMNDNFMLSTITENKKENITTIQLLKKGNTDIPKLEKGRFFEEKDFINKSKYAVIGENILKSNKVSELNGELFYKFENVKYKIIGIIDNDCVSLSNDIFITMMDTSLSKDRNFIIDGMNKNTIESNYNKIDLIYNIEKEPKPINILANSINHLDQQYKLMLGMIVFILIVFILVNRYFQSVISQEVIVKILLGINSNNILNELFSIVAKISLISYLIVVACATIINKFIITFNIVRVMIGTTIFICCGFLITLIMLICLYKDCSKNICNA